MNEITREDLKEKLERGDNIKLVMALGEWAFRAKHIPGSLHFSSPEDSLNVLDPEEEIIVYCSDRACIASQYAYQFLDRHGYKNVWRYAGGLVDWEDAGYQLEGESV
jgi:rhodanese-related sulfurtransferase